MAFNTRHPVGSTDPRDLYDNANNFDKLLNGSDPFYPDRLGKQRHSWEGMEYDYNAAQEGRTAAFNAAQADRRNVFNTFLASSGYEPPFSYAAGRTIERITQTFVRNNIQYRIKDPNSLPYTLTGDWDAESDYFVSMGDSSIRQDLSNTTDLTKGAALIGYKGGTLAEFLSGVGGDVASLSAFGAIGDGETDDTEAVRSAIKDGRAIDWGSGTYLVTEEISETITHAINWLSSGAKIIYSPAAPTQNCIRLKVYPHRHVIRGVLSLQLNKLAFNGIYLLSDADTVDTTMRPLSYPDLIAVDVHVDGAYRASTAFTGGNSVLIEGAWNHVSVIRPRLTNQKMAAGAQVPGEQGIFGLSILRLGSDTAITPHEIYVEDPYIDTVVSEDGGYQMDQDGMRLFTSYNFDVNRAPEFSWMVVGGTIRNCRNREIKAQSNAGRCIGTKLVRTGEVGGAATGNSPSIDSQVGPVTLTNIEFNFRDHAPTAITGSRTRAEDYVQPSSIVSGMKGLISGGAMLPQVVYCTVESSAPNRHHMNISDVDIIFQGSARIASFLTVQTSSAVGPVQGAIKPSIVNMANIVCPVTDAWVKASAINGGFFDLSMVNCHNTISGGSPLITDSSPAIGRVISAVQCKGFTSQPRLDTANNVVGAVSRISSIAPPDVQQSGLIRPVAFTLNDGETYVIPASSFAGVISNILLLSAGRSNATSQGIFLCGSQSISAVGTGSSDWVAGAASEPSTGIFKIWATASGIAVKNAQGSARTFTGLLIG